MYNKKALKVESNKYSKQNPYKKDIIVDAKGQWNHPGKVTRIPSNNITMQGVDYPVWAQPNVGSGMMMQPGQDYDFPGADYVDETPINLFKKGGESDYEELELTDAEIEEYRKGGYIVEELDKFQDGGPVNTYKWGQINEEAFTGGVGLNSEKFDLDLYGSYPLNVRERQFQREEGIKLPGNYEANASYRFNPKFNINAGAAYNYGQPSYNINTGYNKGPFNINAGASFNRGQLPSYNLGLGYNNDKVNFNAGIDLQNGKPYYNAGLIYKFQDGGEYTYEGRPDSLYKKEGDTWLIKNADTNSKYVPIKDPTGKRAEVLNKQAVPKTTFKRDIRDQDVQSDTEWSSAPVEKNKVQPTAKQKQAQQAFNKDFKTTGKSKYEKTEDAIANEQQKLIEFSEEKGIPITKQDLENVANQQWSFAGVGPQEQSDMMQATPEQSNSSRAWEYITNPFTAAEYAISGGGAENMPHNINEMKAAGYDPGVVQGRNIVGNTLNALNPLEDVKSVYEGISDIKKGDNSGYATAGLGLLGFIPGVSEAKGLVKKAGNVVHDFAGPLKHSYINTPEVLKALRQRGKNWDKVGIQGKDLLHKDMINYHGTYHGRPIVEVRMPDGSSEMFYKSSGWAGKEGAGVNGTTEGMWQVYGGHANSPQSSNWFIKDKDYQNYYGSNTFKDIADNMDNALIQKHGFANKNELDNALNFQNRFGSVNTYTPKKKFGGELQKFPDGGGVEPVYSGVGETVTITEKAPDWLKHKREYETANPYDKFFSEKKQEYIKKRPKNLTKLMGIGDNDIPESVINSIYNEYEYNRNNYVTKNLGKTKGFNPRKHDEWVNQLTDAEKKIISNSKYGENIQPSYWARSAAGFQELGNTLLPGKPFNFNIPGLTEKEQQDYRKDKWSALQTLAPLDIPGVVVANYLKNSNREQPNIFSGKPMANVTDLEAGLLNPALITGIGGMAKGLVSAPNLIRQASKTLGTESGLLSNAYKYNPKALKEAQEQMLVRARPVGQDPYINMAEQLKAKQAAGEQLTWYQRNLLNPQTNPQMAAREKYFGQWFADNPSDLDFYINPGTRNFADDAQIEILKTLMPKLEAAKYNVKNFEDAKSLSNLHDSEYILPKNMVQQIERYSVDDLPRLIEEYNQINKPHWLKGYKQGGSTDFWEDDLTDSEIQQLKAQGYEVEELEAIAVPNQYADYISSQGYKNTTGMNKKQKGGEKKQNE
jgi:hypothetical protein